MDFEHIIPPKYLKMRLVINEYSLVIVVFILVACTISNIVNGIELGVHVNHQDLLLKLNSTNTLTPINLNLHVITGSKQAITNFKADILLLHGYLKSIFDFNIR